MKVIVKAVMVFCFTAFLLACSSTEEKPIESVPAEPAVEESSGGDEPAVETASLSNDVSFERGAVNDPASPLNQKVIYFDLDQSSVQIEYQDIVNNHARYLSDYPDSKVRLEGHGDERGSREYNIALGERRAAAVRQMLLLQGVSSGQVNMISYGEELPAALSHDEEAWALNRRVELVYEAQ